MRILYGSWVLKKNLCNMQIKIQKKMRLSMDSCADVYYLGRWGIEGGVIYG